MAYWKCKGEFKGFIDIYGEANANLTATTTGKSYTALADSSGYARIKVKKKGDYTITSDRTIRSAYATIANKTPVTAQYRWNKYQAPLVYAKANQYYEATVWKEIRSGNYQGWSVYQRATGYTFNTSNGYYTLSGGASATIKSGSFALACVSVSGVLNYPYCSTPGQGQSCTEMFQTWEIGGHDGLACVGYYSGYGGFGVWDEDPYYGGKAAARRWYRTSSYQRGEYIGVSSGANLNTYPTDARFSDGYWYVAI